MKQSRANVMMPDWLPEKLGLSVSDSLFFASLMEFLAGEPVLYTTYEGISQRTGLSIRQVYYKFRRLRKRGLVRCRTVQRGEIRCTRMNVRAVDVPAGETLPDSWLKNCSLQPQNEVGETTQTAVSGTAEKAGQNGINERSRGHLKNCSLASLFAGIKKKKGPDPKNKEASLTPRKKISSYGRKERDPGGDRGIELAVETWINAAESRRSLGDLLRAWIANRKARRAACTSRAIELNLDRLERYAQESNMTAKQYLEEIVRRGWRSFFPIRQGISPAVIKAKAKAAVSGFDTLSETERRLVETGSETESESSDEGVLALFYGG